MLTDQGLVVFETDLPPSVGTLLNPGDPIPSNVLETISRAYVEQKCVGEVSMTLHDAKASSRHGAILGTNYGLSTAALRCLSGAETIRDWEAWAHSRTVPLPWIAQASPGEMVRLREAAAGALPAFRARIQKELASADPENDQAALTKLVGELRAEAAVLEVKLRSVDVEKTRRNSNLLAGLGFSIGLLGFSTGNPAIGMAGLGVFSALVRDSEKRRADAEACHAELTGQPAYVVLAADHFHRRH